MHHGPSFQFYPGDWMRNANLRRCSHSERGALIDILCLMHDSAEYGLLRWPLKDIAKSIHAPVALLKALVAKKVLKGCDSGDCEPFTYTPRSGRKSGPTVTLIESQPGPIWFSTRMVKDEHVRKVRAEGRAPMAPFDDGFGDTKDAHQSLTFPADADVDVDAKASLGSGKNYLPKVVGGDW